MAKREFGEVELDKIDISDENVRKSIDQMLENQQESFKALVKSIKEKGVLEPVIVVRKGKRYELPVGQCRTLAAREAGLKKIPAIIYEEMTSTEMKLISAVENLLRIDLSPVDKAGAVKDLVDQMGLKQVVKRLGYSEGWVRYNLGVEGMPSGVKKLVEKGYLPSYEAAQLKPLLREKKPEEVTELAEAIVQLESASERVKAIRAVKRNPKITPKELKAEVKKTAPPFTVKIELSDAEREALQEAAMDHGSSPEDIAHTAISDWLKSNGYISK
jgi:ParB family chromosome partitioning protein